MCLDLLLPHLTLISTAPPTRAVVAASATAMGGVASNRIMPVPIANAAPIPGNQLNQFIPFAPIVQPGAFTSQPLRAMVARCERGGGVPRGSSGCFVRGQVAGMRLDLKLPIDHPRRECVPCDVCGRKGDWTFVSLGCCCFEHAFFRGCSWTEVGRSSTDDASARLSSNMQL